MGMKMKVVSVTLSKYKTNRKLIEIIEFERNIDSTFQVNLVFDLWPNSFFSMNFCDINANDKVQIRQVIKAADVPRRSVRVD